MSGAHVCQKPLSFLGSSTTGLKSSPVEARREAGAQLFAVGYEMQPSGWKPMSSIVPGVQEIRISDRSVPHYLCLARITKETGGDSKPRLGHSRQAV